jgi:RNA polymerase sigma-70 factor (ECF subfamily)
VHNLCIDAQRFRKKEKPCDINGFSHLAAKNVVEVDRLVDQEDDIAVILQHLSERATAEEALALLLREAFGYSYEELSRILNKKQDACRQLVHRGKCAAQGIRAPRRRRTPSPQTKAAFVQAVRQCDMEAALGTVLAECRQ